MSWQEGAALAVVLIGIGAGAFLVAQRPYFWLDCGLRLGRVLLPTALKYLTRRMPPARSLRAGRPSGGKG